MSWDAALYLEKGLLLKGKGFGAKKPRGGEAVFNTGMTGYQEIFTDPSYCEQVVVMTYPHIGSTGVNDEDPESKSLCLSGVVVREYVDTPSNWRSQMTLSESLAQAGVPGIYGVDTRAITRFLRDQGAQRCLIFPIESGDLDAYAKQKMTAVPAMEGLELVSRVSVAKPYVYEKPGSTGAGNAVVYDYGVKTNTLRHLADRGFRVHVVPYNLPAQEVLKLNPKMVMLSNGPGDPATVPNAVGEIQALIGRVPIMAICMGHQLLARALGWSTYKLKFGHHGVNHPVKDLATGRILITSQNHGFCVKESDVRGEGVRLSHVSLNDHTVEGYVSEKSKFLSVQFHPESKPGPNDAAYLFDSFVKGFVQ